MLAPKKRARTWDTFASAWCPTFVALFATKVGFPTLKLVIPTNGRNLHFAGDRQQKKWDVTTPNLCHPDPERSEGGGTPTPQLADRHRETAHRNPVKWRLVTDATE
jgi:hypothetical protein